MQGAQVQSGQGTGSHVLQQKILHATTNTTGHNWNPAHPKQTNKQKKPNLPCLPGMGLQYTPCTGSPCTHFQALSLVLLHHNIWAHVTQPMLLKLNNFGYKILPYPPYPPDLSPINYHFLKHRHNFLQKNAATTSRIQKIFAKSLLNPEAWIFIIQNKQTYFSSYSD